MKKILSAILVLAMAVSMAACSPSSSGSSGAADSASGTATATIQSPDDFAGKKISVQQATTAYDDIYARQEAGLDVEILPYEKITQCFDDLSLKRVDAVYVDSVVAAYYMTDGEDKYQITWKSDEGEPMGVCLSKDNTDLAECIEKAIDTLYYNGKISEIAVKYFGDDVTKGIRDVKEEPVIDTSKIKTINSGKLLIGAEVGYPPMEYTDDTGLEYIGFDIEMGKAIGEILGLEVEFVNTAWDGIFEGLGKKQYDCVISGVSILPERQAKYYLTEPYISNQLVIVTNK